MYKYVYCHDSGEYSDYTSLDKDERKIFGALRSTSDTGTFVYAPTNRDKAILFSYTRQNGQYRVDGYKGELDEIDPNPAFYIGNVTVEKPYAGTVTGAMYLSKSFNSASIAPHKILRLVKYIVFGDKNREIVLTGSGIKNRAAEYLKHLFLLFPPEYARKIGFCINGYLAYALNDADKFSTSGEKPIIRIYAVESGDFSSAYQVNLDANECDIIDSNIGEKALRQLIERGVTRENFDAIFSATESAFTNGKLDMTAYVRCLVRAAYEDSRSLEYAEEILSYGFDNPDSKRIFVDCANRCLTNGNAKQKESAANRAIALMRDDLSAVSQNLISYIGSKPNITNAERDLLVQFAIEEIASGILPEDKNSTLCKYIDERNPAWKQKYALAVEVASRLFSDNNISGVYGVCRVINDKFDELKLSNAVDIKLSDYFDLSPGTCDAVLYAIYAALIKNDCDKSGPHNRTRFYLDKAPSLAEILRVRHEIGEIFGQGPDNDFIFGDETCKRVLHARMDKLGTAELLSSYNELHVQLSDYSKMNAEFLSVLLDVERLRNIDPDAMDDYVDFLKNVDDGRGNIKDERNELDKNTKMALNNKLKACNDLIDETRQEQVAIKNIQEFCDSFLAKMNGGLSETEQLDVAKTRKNKDEQSSSREQQRDSYKRTVQKYGFENSIGLRFNGNRAYGFQWILGLLSGLIVCLIMLIPAISIAIAVGDFSFSAVGLYLSRYFYLAVALPVLTIMLYFVLYNLPVCKRQCKTAFGITAFCAFIPCLLCSVSYAITFIFFT